jgi:hypothetical protein
MGVTIIGGPFIDNGREYTVLDGSGSVVFLYSWTFTVNVNGDVGYYTVLTDTNDAAAEPAIEQDVIDDLSVYPGDLEGIVENDPGSEPGDGGGGPGDFGEDAGDDEGDSAVAGNEGGDDVGESV